MPKMHKITIHDEEQFTIDQFTSTGKTKYKSKRVEYVKHDDVITHNTKMVKKYGLLPSEENNRKSSIRSILFDDLLKKVG